MPGKKPLNIVCIGAGYVGGPTMTVIAQKCPHITVTVFDISQSRIDAWNSPAPATPGAPDQLPIYEPGLAEIVFEVRGKNLFFTTDHTVLKTADVIFVSVNTPTKTQGLGAGRAANLTYIESCARLIAETVTEGHVIIVEKSTVPVRCSVSIQRILSSYKSAKVSFSILSNPEFLAEGTAVRDLLEPERVLIGGVDAESIEALSSIYETWVPKERIVTTNLWSSELSKLVANAFLAQRISSINSITPLCEETGADVEEVRKAISMDRRIGAYFLNPSVGFGGSCFQKDILNLIYLCESLGLHETANYWNQVVIMNDYQKRRFYEKTVRTCFDTLSHKSIAVYGYAFKKDTGDTRESPAIYMCSEFLKEGAVVRIYDPKVPAESIYSTLEYQLQNDASFNTSCLRKDSTDPLMDFIRAKVHICGSALEASTGAAAVVILTEWDEFRTMDYTAVYNRMQKPAFLLDGRLMVDQEALTKIGFEVFCIGKPLRHVLEN